MNTHRSRRAPAASQLTAIVAAGEPWSAGSPPAPAAASTPAPPTAVRSAADGRRRRLDADAVDARAAGEAGQPPRRRLQRSRTRTRSSSPSSPTTTTSRRSAPPPAPDGLPDLFAADIVYVPNWVAAGPVPGHHRRRSTALDFKDEINQGHLAAGTVDGKEHVLPFVLDLSMLFWNKDLFAEAGLDPEKAPANLEEFADAAKAVQALDKHDVYGTATGLNCGGCLVFTWFPSDLGRRRRGHERRRHRVAARERHREGGLLHVEGPVGRPAPCCRRSQDEAGPTWTAGFTEGNVGVMLVPRHPAVVDPVRRRRRRHPRPRRRRIDVRRRRRHRHLEGLQALRAGVELPRPG